MSSNGVGIDTLSNSAGALNLKINNTTKGPAEPIQPCNRISVTEISSEKIAFRLDSEMADCRSP